MKATILIGKSLVTLFWVAVVVSLFDVFQPQVSTLIGWLGVIVLAIHAVEVIVIGGYIGRYSQAPKADKVLVLLFGVFHIMPLWKEWSARIKREGTQ